MHDRSKPDTLPRDIISGLGKGLAIIEMFNEDRRRVAISEAAGLTGLTRAAARRYLLSLVHLGYAEFDGKYFSLTPRVMRLGHAYLAATPLTKLLQPHLDRIAQSGYGCLAAVLDDLDAVCIAQAAPPRTMFMTLSVGSRVPAYRSAVGRILLAFSAPERLDAYWAKAAFEALTPKSIVTRAGLEQQLATIRNTGFAIIEEEVELGLRTIAVPIRNVAGTVVAAMSLGVHADRATVQDMPRELLPLLTPAQDVLRQLP